MAVNSHVLRTVLHRASPQPRIFIGHIAADAWAAHKLYDALCQAAFAPWLAQENLLPGEVWAEKIKATIANSDVFIALLSKRSVRKDGFFHDEIRKAFEEHLHFIPAKIEKCKIKSLKLNKFHRANLSPSWYEGLSRIISSIKNNFKLEEPKTNMNKSNIILCFAFVLNNICPEFCRINDGRVVEYDEDATLSNHIGLDSCGIINLLLHFEELLDISIPWGSVSGESTLRDVFKLLQRLVADGSTPLPDGAA